MPIIWRASHTVEFPVGTEKYSRRLGPKIRLFRNGASRWVGQIVYNRHPLTQITFRCDEARARDCTWLIRFILARSFFSNAILPYGTLTINVQALKDATTNATTHMKYESTTSKNRNTSKWPNNSNDNSNSMNRRCSMNRSNNKSAKLERKSLLHRRAKINRRRKYNICQADLMEKIESVVFPKCCLYHPTYWWGFYWPHPILAWLLADIPLGGLCFILLLFYPVGAIISCCDLFSV